MAPVPPTSYVPGAHGAHAVALAATEPAPHARHALPAEGAAKPAAQVVQEAGSWLAVPGGQVPHAAEPAALYAPLAHEVHEVAPAAAEKVPGAQGAHESAPSAGMLQKRCVHARALCERFQHAFPVAPHATCMHPIQE